MKLDHEKYRKLAGFLLKTRPEEMSCDEWIDRVGEYAERVLAGRPIPASLDEVVRHIEHCPESPRSSRPSSRRFARTTETPGAG